MNEDIERYVREHRCDFMELLCQIISLPSPTGHEQAKGEWILQYLHGLGDRSAYRDEAGNESAPVAVPVGQ